MEHGWMKLTRLLVGATMVLGFGACDRSDTARTAPSETPTPPGGLGTTDPTTPPLAAADVSTLDDDERAAVLRAIDVRIGKEAQLAEGNAGSDGVRQVANNLVVLHRDEMSDDGAIWAHGRLDVTDTAVQRQLESDTANALQVMRALTGPAFDREFLDQEVRAHREGVDLVDRMFPGVVDANLEAEMLRSRPALTIYLDKLTRMQRGVGVAEMQGAAPAEKPAH